MSFGARRLPWGFFRQSLTTLSDYLPSAPNMSSIHTEFKYILSTSVPSFHRVCMEAESCSEYPDICHVTVVSLTERDFGRIYHIVSSMSHLARIIDTYCTTKCLSGEAHHNLIAHESEVPCDMIFRDKGRQEVPANEFAQLGPRYLLLGGVPELNRTTYFDIRLRTARIRVVLEVLWYIGVRLMPYTMPYLPNGRMLQRNERPVSVPLIAWVGDNHLNIRLDQPVTQEMLRCLNRTYITPATIRFPSCIPPRVWCPRQEEWVQTPIPWVLRIQLPLTEIPAVLLGYPARPNFDPSAHTLGFDLRPISSMAYQLYDLPWIWPQLGNIPRTRYTGRWRCVEGTPLHAIQCYDGQSDSVAHGAQAEEDGSSNEVVLSSLVL